MIGLIAFLVGLYLGWWMVNMQHHGSDTTKWWMNSLVMIAIAQITHNLVMKFSYLF